MTTSAGRFSSATSQGSVREPVAAHEIADGGAKTHGQRESGDDARQRDREIGEERAGARFLDYGLEDGERPWQTARIGK
jgi:hypothetical protein